MTVGRGWEFAALGVATALRLGRKSRSLVPLVFAPAVMALTDCSSTAPDAPAERTEANAQAFSNFGMERVIPLRIVMMANNCTAPAPYCTAPNCCGGHTPPIQTVCSYCTDGNPNCGPDTTSIAEIKTAVEISPTTTPNHPVVCMDWCDAQAYCKWAGKRLCGKIGGGPGSVLGKIEDPADPANDASMSQWFNACSQGGKTKYPYGPNYDPAACQADAKPEGGTWPPVLADVGTSVSCRGTAAPYSSILDLSGSVMEFTDECVSAYGYVCAVRGGGKSSPASNLGCAFYGTVNLEQTFDYMGFRCCKDLP